MTSNQPPEEPPIDTRSSHVKAMDRVSQITSMSMSFVVPILGGYYVDQWMGTGYLFTILGMLFGMAAAGVQFRKLLSSLEREQKLSRKKRKSNK